MKCPVCSDIATRHFDHQRVYWFCHHCWLEIPSEQNHSPRTLPQRHPDPMMEKLKARIAQHHQDLVLPHY